MKALIILALALSLTGCNTWKQVKKLVDDVLTVPETVVQDGKDGAGAVKEAVTGEPAPAPAK